MPNMATTSLGKASFNNGKSQGQGNQNKQQGAYKQGITNGASKASNQPAYGAKKYTEYNGKPPSIKKGSTRETDR